MKEAEQQCSQHDKDQLPPVPFALQREGESYSECHQGQQDACPQDIAPGAKSGCLACDHIRHEMHRQKNANGRCRSQELCGASVSWGNFCAHELDFKGWSPEACQQGGRVEPGR